MLINMVLPGAVSLARLPAEYQEVEYIQSSGTQYIDTGFTPNQDTRIVMHVLFTIQGSNQFLFGSREEQELETYSFNCYSTKYRSHYNAGWLDYATSVSYTTPFVLDKNKNVTTLHGEHTVTETYATFTCPYSLVLFGINDGGTIKASAKATLYLCRIYDNGTLARELVPCYRKADDVIGLFDLVNKKFYTNEGSGTFVKGAEIIDDGSSFKFTYSGNYTDLLIGGKGTVRLNTSGTLTVTGKAVTVTATIVGAGGGAAYAYILSEKHGASGGGGGTQTVEITLEPGTYDIVVGTGGTASNATSASANGGTGGSTTAFEKTSTGGKGGSVTADRDRTAGNGGTPNGGDGNASWSPTSLSVAGGTPNGGAVVNNVAQAGGDGYVDLTFS